MDFDLDKIKKQIDNLGKTDYWDFRIQNTNNLTLQCWNSEIKSISDSQNFGYGIRIIKGGGLGFVSGTDFSKIEKEIKKAYKIALLTSTLQKEKIKLKPSKPIKGNKELKIKINPKNISLEEKKNFILEQNKLSKEHSNKIKSIQNIYQEKEDERFFINSEGSNIRQKLYYNSYMISLTAKQNNRTEEYFDSYRKQAGFENTKGCEQITKNAAKRVLEMLSAKLAKGGNFPVICDPVLTGVFIHEAVGHASEADIVLQNDSCLKDRIGQKLASNLVTIIDEGIVRDGLWGSFYYDDEGNPSKKTILMKNGILKTHLTNKETSNKLDLELSGNARAQNFSFLPIVRMTNTYIEKGKSTFEQMLKKVKKGFYLIGSKGGEVSTLKGEFIFAAQQGYLIENGNLTRQVKGVSLGGNTLKILNSIKMIENKYGKDDSGFCGKIGQWVPVNGPNPSILIEEAAVGGSKW